MNSNLAYHEGNNSEVVDTEIGLSDSLHNASIESRQTTIEEPRAVTFEPNIFNSGRVVSRAYPQEVSLSSPASTSFRSTSSSEDLAKTEIATALVNQQIGACNHERSDATLDAPPLSSWRFSQPPVEEPSLPLKRQRMIWRKLRHRFLDVYQRLFAIVFVGNMIALIIMVVTNRKIHPFGPSLESLATATSTNVMGAILIRQEIVINALYTVFASTPLWMPLRMRRMVAKLYHLGGIHSGCAVSATTWFILYTAIMTKQYVDGDFYGTPVIAITYILLALLFSICVLAIPKFRSSSHNTFEAVHRFGGWLAIALFWVETLLVCSGQSKAPGADSLGIIVIKTPTFWLLLIITFFIILPWIRLQKVRAWPEVLSDHVVRIHFNHREVGAVLGVRITHSPLTEWHTFAAIPEGNGSSFSVIVSDAGDWTKKQIAEPSNAYWIRGIPVAGLLRMAPVFKRVIIVATGSGIGPCLSLLISHPMSCRILWSTPNPLQTYGEGIMQAVMHADPEAMVINTKASGRPDMVALTYHLFFKSKAEAVFIISNRFLTKKVVYGMQSRGIPAYGPIWDS